MIIRKYGLTLRRLQPEHLELVRQQRNSDAIRRHMFYQKEISQQEQQAWYATNHNKYNYYFIIEYQQEFIGVISGKNVNYDAGVSEGGIFVWDQRYWNSFVPVMATVIMADLTFLTMEFNRTLAEVRSDNAQQMHYNRMLGYVDEEPESKDVKRIMVLTKANYLKVGGRIRRAVQRIGKDDTAVSVADFDFSGVSAAERRLLYTGHQPHLQAIFDERFERLNSGEL